VRGSTSREIVVFALALVLVPPAVLVAVELLVGLASRRAADALHLVFVVGLAALIVLQVAKRIEALPPWVAVAVAVTLALALGVLYARTRFVPTLLTALAPAPLVFLGLFLLTSPVSKLVFVEEVAVRAATVQSSTPVVMLVLDEFNPAGLMDARRRLDAERFPNFAALARQSNWYRDATTVHAHTEKAVPAILTGRLPERGALPVHADHPRNLFTLLGRRYRMNVIETLTRLCPRNVCTRTAAQHDAAVGATRTESLVSDAAIVYGHVLLPEDLTGRLPPITDTWTDFRGADEQEAEARACGRKFCAFAARIGASQRPSLSFLHALLPHVPWQYLPAGRRYANEVRRIPGVVSSRWGRNRWLVEQGYQRYLLQLGYTDAALGLVLERLRAVGLYDRSLIVVTGDHGAGFTPGEPRRLITHANAADLAFVPLIVKLPRQRTGRTIGGLARTVDILPTIADALGARPGWRFDGRSLLGRRLPADGVVEVGGNAGTVSVRLSELRRRQQAGLQRRAALFGRGSFDGVYRFGSSLVGRRVADLAAVSGTGSATLNGASLFDDVDVRSDLVPSYLTGRVSGVGSGARLAIAVNGVVAAVTQTYGSRFAAMISPESLRAGKNDVAVYAVRGGSLQPLGGAGLSYTLRGGALVSQRGSVSVVRGALRGQVRLSVRPDSILFGGWAVDPRARQAADAVVVVRGTTSVYVGSASNYARPDIERRYGVADAGFIFEAPRAVVGDGRGLRVFVVRGRVASELPVRR
jgi:hypothetical protein